MTSGVLARNSESPGRQGASGQPCGRAPTSQFPRGIDQHARSTLGASAAAGGDTSAEASSMLPAPVGAPPPGRASASSRLGAPKATSRSPRSSRQRNAGGNHEEGDRGSSKPWSVGPDSHADDGVHRGQRAPRYDERHEEVFPEMELDWISVEVLYLDEEIRSTANEGRAR